MSQPRLTMPSNPIIPFLRLQNPTFPIEDIKLLYAIDPLGSPYNTTNLLAAIGGDQTLYGTNGTTLDNFLDEVWPETSATTLVKGPRVAVQGFGSDADVFQEEYSFLCGMSCLAAGGIPSLWLAQPAFQKYRTFDDDIAIVLLLSRLWMASQTTFRCLIFPIACLNRQWRGNSGREGSLWRFH